MIPHPSPLSGASYSAAELSPDDAQVVILDQRLLPLEEKYLVLDQVEQVAEAIRTLTVRGAPAIGIAAAYAMVLAAREEGEFGRVMERAADVLKATRPTAVNLAHGVDTLLAEAHEVRGLPRAERIVRLAERARAYHRADVEACRTMGRLGQALLPEEGAVLTHCNAGALATGGYGSALGVIRAAREANKRIRVIADETRPLLQGARLTAWELMRDGIPVTLITDSMAASLMAKGGIVAVVVGADRIARNGDVANKIGTYGVACLARVHDIPFYVAAPWSTVDLACESGAHIPIEGRRADEVTSFGGRPTAPHGIAVENPSFDVTPARLVTAIMTERGVVAPVDIASLK